MVPLTLNCNDICAQNAEPHNVSRPTWTTPVLVNYHSGFYHRFAHLPSLQQILEVVNILYNPQSSSSKLLLIYFHHSHLFIRDGGGLSGIWQWLIVHIWLQRAHLPGTQHPPPDGQIVPAPSWSASASTSICLCFAPSFCFMISFLKSNPWFWCLDSALLALFVLRLDTLSLDQVLKMVPSS